MMTKKILFIITILMIYFTGISQNKIIVKVDTSAKIQHLTTTGNAGNVGITGGNSLTINVNDLDSVKTNEGLMTLTGTTAPYTYSSNTTGTTDLILQQGTNMTIVRSGNTLTFNSSGSGGGATYTAGSGINIDGSNVISNTRDISKSGNSIILSNGGSTIGIASNTPTSGQVLKWNGTNWVGDTDLTGGGGGSYTAGTGISIVSDVITNTGDLSTTNELQTISKSGNTVSLTSGGTFNIASTTPSLDQVLTWNGTNWIATTLSGGGGGGTVTSISIANGGGISVSGSPITTSGTITLTANDQSATNEIQTLSKSGNTFSLSVGGGSANISSTTPSAGQVLKWNGTNWVGDTDLTGGGGGGQLYSSGAGITVDNVNFTISAVDQSATNEIDQIGVSSSLTGGGRIMNYTGGFSNGTGTQLIINNATASVSTSSNGGSITWTLPDVSASNEIQTLSASGNSISLTDGGSVNIAKSGTGSSGKVLKYDGTNWTYGDDNNTTYTAGTGISIVGTTISSTVTNTDAQTLSTSGAAGNITISNGNTINLNVNDADASTTNELQTISKTGNVASLTSGGTFNISQSVTPSSGQVLKWDGSQWNAADDATGGGSGGGTYSGGSGITVDNVNNIITNTGDLSSTNEIDKIGISASLTGGARLMNYTGGFSNGTGTQLIITGATSSVTTSSDGGAVTWTLPDASASNELNTLSKSGNVISASNGGGSVNISQSVTPSSGQVLKWNGSEWNAATDDNTSYSAGTGISISGGVISSTVTNTDAQTLTANTGTPGSVSISGGNTVTLNVNDADASTTNEIQTISKTGNVATLTSGGTFNISQSVTPSSGQALKWDGAQWNAAADENTTYTAGSGLTLSGTQFSATDASTTNEIQTISKTGNVATLSAGGGTFNISQSVSPSTNQVLKWDGAQWNAAADNNDVYTAGTGISISGNVVTNTGDLSSTNELQTLGTGTNTITLTSGGSVGLKTVNGTTILGSGDITVASTNIYTSNGSVPSSTSRLLTLPNNSRLFLGDWSNAYLDLNNTSDYAEFGYGANGAIAVNATGLQVRASNGLGANGQVLTSNGTYAQWQTPAAPALDGIATQGTNYASVSNGSDLPLFGGGASSSVSSVSGNGFIKGVSSGIYEVNVVVNPTTADADGFVQLGLYRSGSLIHNVKLYNHISGEAAGDVIYTFVTDANSGTFTVRNTTGSSIGFDIKRVTVKRVL